MLRGENIWVAVIDWCEDNTHNVKRKAEGQRDGPLKGRGNGRSNELNTSFIST